jgi:hypothetical protein
MYSGNSGKSVHYYVSGSVHHVVNYGTPRNAHFSVTSRQHFRLKSARFSLFNRIRRSTLQLYEYMYRYILYVKLQQIAYKKSWADKT